MSEDNKLYIFGEHESDFCLDKQKVREVIDKYIENTDSYAHNKIYEELGL